MERWSMTDLKGFLKSRWLHLRIALTILDLCFNTHNLVMASNTKKRKFHIHVILRAAEYNSVYNLTYYIVYNLNYYK